MKFLECQAKINFLNAAHATVCNARGKIIEQFIALEMSIDNFVLQPKYNHSLKNENYFKFSEKINCLTKILELEKINVGSDFTSTLEQLNSTRHAFAHWKLEYDSYDGEQFQLTQLTAFKGKQIEKRVYRIDKLHSDLVLMTQIIIKLMANLA